MYIIANPSNNISISSTSTTDATVVVGQNLNFLAKGIDIKAPLVNQSAIFNRGRVNLENLSVQKFPNSTVETIKNSTNAVIEIQGNVIVE